MTTLDYTPVIALLGDRAPKDTALLEKITDALFRAVVIEAMSKMSDETLTDFDALLERNAGPEILAAFLQEKVPDIERIARTEAARLLSLSSAKA
jgi:hypothetical protein